MDALVKKAVAQAMHQPAVWYNAPNTGVTVSSGTGNVLSYAANTLVTQGSSK